jgi:uncharacterized protein YacL
MQFCCYSAIILMAAFWSCWFLNRALVSTLPENDPRYTCYTVVIDAFLLADAWLTACCVACLAGLKRDRRWASLYAILAGASGIFLGLMDLCYDVQNSIFDQLTMPITFEIILICCSLAMGTLMITLGWRSAKSHTVG